jgi:hypothetical protein
MITAVSPVVYLNEIFSYTLLTVAVNTISRYIFLFARARV